MVQRINETAKSRPQPPEPSRRLIASQVSRKHRRVRLSVFDTADVQPLKRFGMLLETNSSDMISHAHYELHVSRHFDFAEVMRWIRYIGG
jgi:hypothetical protein